MVLMVALLVVPAGAWGADLVVWWDEGYYPCKAPGRFSPD
jgi:hypothetical protein